LTGCYVLNNFNLTEGITRINSPLWFSSSSTTSKHIANNLSSTINSTIIFNVDDCSKITRIEYISDTGSYNNIYSSGEFTCENNVVTLQLQGIEPAQNSNIINIVYAAIDQGLCASILNLNTLLSSQLSLIFLIIIMGVALSVVMGSIIYTSMFKESSDKGNPYGIIVIFIIMLVGSILLVISSLMTTGICNLG